MTEYRSGYCESAMRSMWLLQGKHKIEILCILRRGPRRLDQLFRLMPTVSKKVFTENLRQLEATSIVTRRDLSGQVRHIEYGLSKEIETYLRSLLDQLKDFGAGYESKAGDRQQGHMQ